MFRSIKKKSIVRVTCFLSYFLLLMFVYYFYVTSFFSYAGHIKEFNSTYVTISLLSIFVASLLIPACDDVRSKCITILVLVWLIPNLVFFSAGQGSLKFYLIASSAFLLFIIFSGLKISVIRLRQVEPILLSRLMLVMSSSYLLSIIALGGLEFINFNLGEVYAYRDAASENLPKVFSYISPIITKIVLPVFVVLSIINKKKIEAMLGIIISFLFFALTSHKAPVFFPVIIMAIYWASGRNFPVAISCGLIGLVAVCGLDFYVGGFISDTPWIGSLFVRRSLMTSPLLDYFYIDFFSQNKFYYWADSRFSLGLIASPHPLTAPHMIGDYYFGNAEMSANAGFLGSGYANAGLIGVYIYAGLVGIIVSSLNSYGAIIGSRLVTSMSAIVLIAIFTSTDLTTALLTHGLAGLFILLAIMPKSLNPNL